MGGQIVEKEETNSYKWQYRGFLRSVYPDLFQSKVLISVVSNFECKP